MDVPSEYLDLVTRNLIAHLATMNPDGSPQNTPIWFDFNSEEGTIFINTAKGRKKYRNILQNPKVALSITDPDNPYRYLAIQGEVIEIMEDPVKGLDHLNMLSQRYVNSDWNTPKSQHRVMMKISISHICATHVKPL